MDETLIDIRSTEYTVVVYNSNGVVVGMLNNFTDLAIVRVTNGYDTLQMSILYGIAGASYLVADSIVKVYRKNDSLGIPSTLEFSGTIVKTVVTQAEITMLTVTAFGFEHILSRRIIAWPSNREFTTVFGLQYPSYIIQRLLNSNIGADATSTVSPTYGKNRMINGVIPNFETITYMTAFGDLISSTDGLSLQNLLNAVQEVALAGNIGFAMDWNESTNTYSWRMAEYRLGSDRSSTVIFSTGTGTAGSIETTIDYTQSWNTVIMKGKGTGAGATSYIYPSNHPTGLAQRETFLTSADGTTSSNPATAVLAYKEQLKNITQVTCSVQQALGLLYGRDYFVSDLVSVQTNTQRYQLQVKSVALSMSSDGVETIGVTLENE
jgi:hypothetical protein